VSQVILDDGDLVRLAQIERQLAQDDPELAEALRSWRPPVARTSFAATAAMVAYCLAVLVALFLWPVVGAFLAVVAAVWLLWREKNGASWPPGSSPGESRPDEPRQDPWPPLW
jgi:Protein of unknown function (DUF3040)